MKVDRNVKIEIDIPDAIAEQLKLDARMGLEMIVLELYRREKISGGKAAELLGSATKLARRLRVPSADLIEWMNDKAEPPQWVFLRAVDIVLEETPPPAESDAGDPPAPREAAEGASRSGMWC